MVVRLIVFLSSANLICRSTDISKCFIESLGVRDNESRLLLCQFAVNAQNSVDKSVVVIPTATAIDGGTYTCTAKNQYETNSASTVVRITGKYTIQLFIWDGSAWKKKRIYKKLWKLPPTWQCTSHKFLSYTHFVPVPLMTHVFQNLQHNRSSFLSESKKCWITR